MVLLCGWVALATTSSRGADLFPDKNLEAAVRQYVFAKRDTEKVLTEDDVKNISTIKASGKKIRDLTGLEKCRSLALLNLENNEVVNLEPIRDLKNIQSLDLAGNKIRDVGPLAGLEKLQYLMLHHNQISDLAPLKKLVNLRTLSLSQNRIKDLSPLADLKKLWSLYLEENQVEDIRPLAPLKNLSSLDLRSNQVSDLSPLSAHTEYRYLILDNNKIKDLSVLVAMAKKDAEKDKRFAPFWHIYLTGNPLGENALKKQMAELKKVGSRPDFKKGKGAPPGRNTKKKTKKVEL